MSTSDRTPREFDDRTIVFHFDVESHSLPLRQFVDTAKATQSILDNFNEELWGGKVKFELRVMAPESGGLIETIGIVVFFGGGMIWAFVASDAGKGYIRGLTGHEPEYWTEKLGEEHRKFFSDEDGDKGEGEDEDKNDKSPPHHLHYMPREQMERMVPQVDSVDVSDEKLKELEASFIAKACVGFLETLPERLEEMGFSKEKFKKAYEAKNQVYKACINNPEVRGLGFDHSHSFKFEKKDFAQQITDLNTETDAMKAPEEWKVEVVDIFVNSPNWNRGAKRKWQGSTGKYKNVKFSIEDEYFWHRVDNEDITSKCRNNMRVQWVYKVGASKPSYVQVLRVLTYNGHKISDPLSKEELREEWGNVWTKEGDPDVFDIISENQGKTREVKRRRDE